MSNPNTQGNQPKVMAKPVEPKLKKPQLARPTKIGWVGIILAIIGFFGCYFLPIPGLEPMSQRMLAIFVMAICLWVTEALPLSATGVLVILLEVLLISDHAIVAVPSDAAKYSVFFATLADPVIVLFLGGFMLADAAAKFKLDRALAAVLLKPFLGNPRLTLMGIMLITAVLSMFMSNTATTATMFAVMMPVLAGLPKGRSRTGLALSIPVAANVGGMGTPVGTPPNAIALGALAQQGIAVTFLDWMIMAVPLMLAVLVVSWLFLAFYFIPKDVKIQVDTDAKFDTSSPAITFYVVAAITVGLWMTEFLHGISANVVGFVPVVILMVTQVMTGEDMKKLDWPVLWLVAGGIALGKGVGVSGLDKWLIGSIDWNSMSSLVLIFSLAALGFAMSNVISHSASANLLIPLGIGLAMGLAEGAEGGSAVMITVAVVLALGCSLGMSLPISTPPNAIAYSTKEIPTKDMAITGLVVGITGVLLLAFVCPWYWNLVGM